MLKLKYVLAFFGLLIAIEVNAAFIDTLNGPPSAFNIVRGSEELEKIAPFKPLQTGDEITITKPTHDFDHISNKENFIILALDNGIFKTLKYIDTKTKPYTIMTTAPPSVWRGTMNAISVWLNRLWKNDIQVQPLHVLDGEPSARPMFMRLFKGNDAKLVAGVRKLHLAWYGGQSPYRVQVSKIGVEMWDEKDIATVEITLPKQMVKVGRYQVVVTDAQGKKVSGEFTAAEAPSVLQNTEARAIKKSNLSLLAKKTLLAVLLAKQGGWYFEAYQRVALITGYYPARLVKQGLERGSRCIACKADSS